MITYLQLEPQVESRSLLYTPSIPQWSQSSAHQLLGEGKGVWLNSVTSDRNETVTKIPNVKNQ